MTKKSETQNETPKASTLQLQYIDRPDIAETFADHVRAISFDGQTLRLEFGVTRLDDTKSSETPTGRRYPCCRIVMSPGAATELMNQMQLIAAKLVQAGILKTDSPPPASKN